MFNSIWVEEENLVCVWGGMDLWEKQEAEEASYRKVTEEEGDGVGVTWAWV